MSPRAGALLLQRAPERAGLEGGGGRAHGAMLLEVFRVPGTVRGWGQGSPLAVLPWWGETDRGGEGTFTAGGAESVRGEARIRER